MSRNDSKQPLEESPFRAFPDAALTPSALPRPAEWYPHVEVYRSIPAEGITPFHSGMEQPLFRSIQGAYDDGHRSFSNGPDAHRSSRKSDPFSLPASDLRPSPLRRESAKSRQDVDVEMSDPKDLFPSLPQPLPQHSAPVFVPIEPPPVPGGYLEPSSHFLSRATPRLLMQELKAALESAESDISGTVDISLDEPKFKIKCVAYKPGEFSVPFIARVFNMGVDGLGKRYALELQRRSGDPLNFWEIWSVVKRHFYVKGLIENGNKMMPVPQKKMVAQLDVEVTPEQIQTTVKCLLQMAASECVDVKSQAIQALYKMSITDARTQQLMVGSGCVEILLDSVNSKLEEIHRCAASALANLGHDCAPVCKAIAQNGGVKSLCGLIHSSATAQVHRECSRMLRSLALTLGVSIVCQELRQTVKLLQSSQDVYVRQQAGHLLEVLRLG